MMKLLEETTPNAIHFTLLAPTAVIASIGPGSIVSNDSYNNLPMIHIVRTKSANTPGNCPIPNMATNTAANNKSGIVRTILRTKRDGIAIHFV